MKQTPFKPTVGQTKTVLKFALLPTKVCGRWLWFSYYLSHQQYNQFVGWYAEVVRPGIICEGYIKRPYIGHRWEETGRELIPGKPTATGNDIAASSAAINHFTKQ